MMMMGLLDSVDSGLELVGGIRVPQSLFEAVGVGLIKTLAGELSPCCWLTDLLLVGLTVLYAIALVHAGECLWEYRLPVLLLP